MAIANKTLGRIVRLTPFRLGCLLVVCSIGLYISFAGEKPPLLHSLDNQLITAMFHWRGRQATTDKVVIVDIDEASLARYGQWPWSRDLVARLVDTIGKAQPKVLGLDIVFAEPDRSSPKQVLPHLEPYFPALKESVKGPLPPQLDYDVLLGDALSKFPTVLGYPFQTVLPEHMSPGESPWPSATFQLVPDDVDYDQLALPVGKRAITNIADVAQGYSEGFFNVFPDSSGTVRRVPLIMSFQSLPYPSLALEMVRLGAAQQMIRLHTSSLSQVTGHLGLLGVEIGALFLPTDDRGQVSVNFRGPEHTFRYLSAADVLSGYCGELLHDRYVLLGTSAAGLHDLRATPFSSVVPGVEVHATIIDNVLQNDLFSRDMLTETGLTVTILLIGGLVMTACLAFAGPLTGGLSALLLLIAVVVGNYQLFFLRHVQIGVVYQLLSFATLFLILTLYNYVYTVREKRFIRGAFGHYVSQEVIGQLVKNPDKLTLSGEEKELSAMFCDIRSFTTLSEKMATSQLARFMNIYLTEMSHIIMRENGLVDKYIGDAIMAIWGAPLDDEQHAVKAVRSALLMKAALPELNKSFFDSGLPAIDIGFGINTGLMQVGNFGSVERFNYTVLGDHVNLAARLEGLNKIYGTQILISEFTYQQVADTFSCRLVDWVRVKGKSKIVAIYEPLSETALDPQASDNLEQHHRALELYQKRDFAGAAIIFTQLFWQEPHPLYALYLQRCEHYQKHPPAAAWDGVASYS